MKTCTSLVILLFLATALGFPSGGPETACQSLTPEHDTSPQNSPSPFLIKLAQNEVLGGQRIGFNLTSNSGRESFKGFFIQGKKIGEKGDKSAGFFSSSPNAAKPVKCFKVSGSAATHTSGEPKDSVFIEWEAPNEEGEYILYTTFVKDYSRFWVRVPSETIRVKRDATLVAVTTEKPKLSPRVQNKIDEIHAGCGESKGCFGYPSKCIENGICEMATTHKVEGNRYIFEVYGKASKYVASGLSYDDKMGKDSVIACINDGGEFRVWGSYNDGPPNQRFNFFNREPGQGLSESSGSAEDEYIFCKFTRAGRMTHNGEIFDLHANEWHIIMSRGSSVSQAGVNEHEGSEDRTVSGEAQHLTSTNVLGSKSNMLLKLHGSFMMIGWLLCASSGMFISRYFKQTHTHYNPLGKAFWFVLHLFFMITTATLSIVGAILIFVYVDGYSNGSGSDAHPILGIIVNCLAGCQIFIALFRCAPGSPKRPIFNWIHWTIGNSAHILSIATIFVAKDLTKTNLTNGHNEYYWVLGIFVLFHILMHITMSIHTVVTDRKMETSDRKRGVRPGPMKPTGLSNEAPGSGFRTFMLVAYLLGAASAAIALIVIFLNAVGN